MINHIYGGAFREFTVEKINKSKQGGRVVKNDTEKPYKFKGILSETSQKEWERYNQLGHDCSHKIATRTMANLKAGDKIIYSDKKNNDGIRIFTVTAKRNPADLHIWEIILVKELMSND